MTDSDYVYTYKFFTAGEPQWKKFNSDKDARKYANDHGQEGWLEKW